MSVPRRRGSVELPVTAIFMIVAGSIIILFFVVITQHQARGASEETEARTLNFLDTLIKTSATAKETATNITIVNDDVLFTCDEEGMRFGFISENTLPLFDVVVFAPRKLSGGELNAYSQAENIPFRAFNVLYLTTPEYVVDTTHPLTDLPHIIQTRSVPIGSRGEKGTRMVITEADENDPNTRTAAGPLFYYSAGRPADLLIIRPNPAGTYGTVTYRTLTSSEDVVYPTTTMLTGALLSRDKATYDCVFNTYLQQLKYVIKLYRDRAAQLKFESPDTCRPLYQLDAFDAILGLPDAEQFDEPAAATYNQAIREIIFVNEQLLKGDNCVSLY